MDQEEKFIKLWDSLSNLESIEDKSLPLWVRNIIESLHETSFKELAPLVDGEPSDPKTAGLAIGLAKHLETIASDIFEKIPNLEDLNSKLSELGEFQNRMDELEQDSEKFEEYENKTLETINNGSNHDESNFLLGKSEGLQSLQDKDGNFKHQRKNTGVLMLLLISWPDIEEKCKTRRDVYEYLLRKCWKPEKPGEQFDMQTVEAYPPPEIGSYDRIKKILERIEFSPARPGRPRKT
jgi:hypothetical protein